MYKPSGECCLAMWATIATISGVQFCVTIPWPLVLEQSSAVITFEWHMLCMTLKNVTEATDTKDQNLKCVQTCAIEMFSWTSYKKNRQQQTKSAAHAPTTNKLFSSFYWELLHFTTQKQKKKCYKRQQHLRAPRWKSSEFVYARGHTGL